MDQSPLSRQEEYILRLQEQNRRKKVLQEKKGMALENGVAGGNVTIKNLSSDKKFQAKVLNENSVKVHL